MLRKSLFNKFAAITVSLAIATGFFSCGENAGLGSSIDTKAPTLAIEYPPSGAAIRDSFILAGSCSDDKAISRVLVTVKRLESDIEFEPLSYTATVSADAKSWQIKLNEKDEANESYYNGWQLPDGKYEMSVTAYDNVGNNSGASSRSFEIDNTPPLFIISNPGVVKNENKEPSAYGSVFTIDGTIADNHEIASMDVEIYNEAGELLSKEKYNDEEINSFREEEIPTAGGTSVQIAQYVEGESNNRYSTLHPESRGTEYYYAKITLADATQVYQNPPKSKDRAADEQVEVLPEDLVGNKSSKFYLYDDVYTSLISKKNGKGLSAAALKDIVSGIISDKATLAYLANAEKDSSNEENYLCFSLNPEANPTYNISGFGYEYNNVYQSASCGNTVNITINSGLDNVAVNPGTVKVWLKEFDSIPEKEKMTKDIMELAGKVKNRESVSDGGAIFDGETADEDKKIGDWSLIYDYSNYSGSSVSTKTFAITLPSKGIVLNKFYVLAVTGYDVDEVAFKQDAVYAFAGNVSGIAPTIEIKSPDNGSFVKAGEFSFEGTAVVNNADLNVKSLEATIKATNGTQAIGNEEGYSVKVTYNSTENHWPENDALAVVWNEEESVWKWTFTPSKIKDFLSETKDATKYALSIKGVSSSDHDVTMSSMVQLDITPPVVSINTITPIVEGKDFDGSDNVYINGTVRIMGTIVEQNLKEVTYDIFAKTEDEDDFVSILEMMKEASSQGSYSSDLFDGKLEQSNSIDISFPTTYLTAYYAKKTGKADPKITIKVTLMAEDIVGNKGEYSSTIYNKTLENLDGRDFIIYQETDRPKITLDNAFTEYKDNGVTKSLLWKESDDLEHNNSCNINTDHNLFGTVSNNRLQVSASDDDALSAIRISVFAYKDDKDELVGGGSSFFSKTTGTYKCDLPDEEGVYKVKVEAFDSKILPTDLNDSSTSFGYNSTDEFYIAISSGAPNIEISKPYAGSYQSGTVDIAGSVTKKEWIKSVEGALNQNGELLESIVVSEPAFASQEATAWNSSVTLPTNASGNYSLVYTVTDRFGQKNSVERSFMVDIYPPKFKIEEPDSENRNVFTKDGIYTVKGSISDGEGTSGIKGLYYSLKAQTASGDTYKPFNGDKLSDDWQQASVIAKEKGQFTWTANIDLTGIASTDGSESNTVYFAAIDEAGNISLISENSDSSSLKITRDTVAPSTTLLGSGLKKPAGNVVSGDTGDKDEAGNLILEDDSELEESLTYYANGSYTLSGLVTEVSPADVTITAKMGTNDLTVTRDETNSKKWSVVGGTDEGTHAYEITFTDKAGNSVTKKISVIKDSEKPSLTVSNETTDKDALVTNKLITEENTNHSIENGIHKYLLSGKWSDKTSGTGKLQYRVRPHKEDDSYVDFYSDWRDISDVTTSTAESSWSFKVDMLEGYGLGTGVWMQGRAIDAAGNITYTEEYKDIRVDFGKPTVTKTSEAPEYVAKDGKLTITGTVSDSYKLSSSPVIVVAKIDGTEVENGEKGFSFTQNVAEDTKTGTYTITLNASDSNNGEWTFEVKANDWADRESAALSFSTTVDTVAPAWNEIKVNNELYDSDANRTWYKNATLPFSGSLTETGSKVKEIQWSVIKAGASEPAEGDTGTVSPKADNTFNTNIGEFIAKKDAGGNAVANTVKLVAVDYAGNKSVEKTFNIYIDSEAPTLVKSNKDGTQFSNKEAALDVALEASDDASGVKSVTLSITLDGSTTPLEISSGKTTIETTETSGKWNATIPSTFLANLENKTYAVKAKIADNAKNTSDMTLFRIDVDDEKPTIGKLSVTNTNAKYSVYKSTTETETYFVHNGDGNKFEILGAVQDAKSGVARVELWKDNTKLAPTTNTAISSLPISDIDLSEFTGSATLTLKAFDNAGNVQTQDIVVNFDNDAPKGIHAIDEKNKDIFFRLGVSNSDETEITKGQGGLWNDDIDLDVGGKYSNNSYSNSQTIRVRGAINDAGSGVEMIYYKVINSTSELSQDGADGLKVRANDFLQNYKTDNNGYFKADKVSKKRVTYTSTEGKLYDTNGDYVSLNGADTIFKGFAESFGEITFTENGQEKTKKYATITTNYDNSFTGFDDGYNYLILVAVDNVGNTALDTVTIVQGGVKVPYSNFSLNVDTETPKFESNTKNTQFTNCADDFDVDGTFEDNASGVNSVVLDIVNDKDSTTVHTITLNKDSTGWTQTETNNGKSGTWRATISAKIFPENTTATFSVIAKVTDVAGNSSSSNIFNIQIDRVAPEFKNTLLATTSATYKVYRPDEEADTYNVNPSNGTFSISGVATDDYGLAEVSLSIPGIAEISPVENASFNFAGLDLSGLSGTSTTATLTVTDKAGNTATKPVTINFDKTGPSWVADDFKVNDTAFDTTENAKNWYKDNLLSFAGSYTDSSSEIEKVTYTIVPAGAGTQSTGTFSTTKGSGENAGKETFTTNLKGFVDKTGDSGEAYNLVKLTAYDKVGNPATKQEFKIYIDTTAPTLESDIKTTKLTNGTADIPVSGTFSDNASGVKSIVLEVLDDNKNVVENGKIELTSLTGNEWSTSISKSILPENPSASRSVRVTITDNAGNPASSTIFNIQIDKEAPVFKTAVLAVVEPEEPETATYKVYKPNENEDVYYVNPTVDKFKISGVATDKYGVTKVELSIPGLETITPAGNGSFDFTGLDLRSQTETSVVATLTAYDEAENSVSKNITIKFDTTVPSLVDNDFTIGGKNVGETNWFKDSRLTFAGTYSEAGSGIEQIQYTIIKAGTDDTQKQTGSFGTTVLTGGKESFSQSLGDFIEKAANATSGQIYNTVKLVAVDKVGNKSSETVSAIYIDTTAPDATSIESETPYTNGTGEGTLPIISGTVSDANAGLSSVVIKVNDKEISESTNGNLTLTKTGTEGEGENAVTYNEKLWKWEVAIKHSVFSDVPANTASKNFSVTAVVTDNAGNRQEVPVGNVIADKVAPIVELKAPTDRDTDEAGTQINGTISLEGTISDKNVLPDTAITGIRYNTSSATLANTSADWKELSSVEEITLGLSGNYTFTVTGFDTTKLADGTYYIQAVAKDSAGNTGYSDAQTVIISQDTDRPKVNITNLVKNDELGYLLQYGTNSQVNGDIYDDDSNAKTVVKEFYITEYPVTAKPTTTDGEISYTFEEEGTGDSFTNGQRTAVNCSSDYKASTGKFIFRPSTAADGQKHFYICIVDNDDKVFYTTYEAPAGTAENKKYLQNPKILINSNRPTKKENNLDVIDESVNTQQFSYTSDSHSPEVSSGKGLPYDSGKNVATGFDFGTDTSNLGASFGAGGTKRKFVKLQFSAKDSSGIAGMTLELLKGSESLKKLATAEKIAGVEVVTDSNGYSVDVGVGKGEFSGTQNDTPAIWTTDYIDVSGWEKGQISVKVTAYDRIGLSATGSYSFVVDNSAPVIKVNSPVSGTKHTGAVTIGGSANDDGDAGTDSIKWHVLSVAEQTALTGKTASQKETYLRDLTWNEYLSTDSDVTVNNWKFVFDKKLSDLTETEKENLKFEKYNPMFDLFDTSAYGTAVEGYYPLKVYFMAEDKYGNFTIEENYVIHHDSDGDRPRASFTYPNKDNYDEKTDGHEEYVTLGGAIRLQGTATIPNAQAAATVEHVYIQLVHADDTAFNKDYAKELYGNAVLTVEDVLKAVYGNEQGATKYSSITSAIDTINNATADATAKANAYALLKQYGFYSPDEVDSWWGIKTSGTVSWSHAINASNELNPETDGTTNNIKIRACGVNSEGKFGAWSSGDDLIRINVDSSVPRISAELCQLESLPSSLPSTTVSPTTYTDGINLRGQWYLVLTILDESGLHSTTPYNISSKSEWTTKDFVFNQNSDKGKKVYVQLTTASGSHSYTVKATDTDNKSVTQTFTVNIDNSAPELSNIKANGSPLTDTQTISDSDYVFDLSGEAEDGGVGVERVVFYYMRDSGTKTGITAAQKKIYDPMIHATANDDGSITYGSVDMPSSFTNVASGDIDLLEIEQDPTNTSIKHKLYARKLTGTSTTDTFTYDTGFDAHVRVGGLIYIDNQYRRITEIDDDKKVVTFSPAKSAEATSDTAWFPIAQVIDSEMSEEVSSFNTDPFTFKKNDGKDKDDGDKMPETFTTNGNTTRNWSAKIHSSNLPDGPISLVILAFDKAGNVNSTTITTTVSNNPPRVAKLFLATDLNDNSKFENDEFESYSLIGAEGTAQDNYVLDFNALDKDNNKKFSAGVFTAKNKLAVVPEIVGGNGAISLVAKKEADGTTEATARPKDKEETDTTTVIGTEIPSIASRVAEATDAAALTSASGTQNYSITADNFAAVAKGNKFYAYVLNNAFLSGIQDFEANKATADGKTTNKAADGENKPFSFTFWDSTDLTTQGTDSQKAVILVKNLTLELTDDTKPTVVVNPFYWKDLNSNSVYGSSESTVKLTSDLKGHIELENDIKNISAITSTLGDDPKVSGKITFTGTTYDEKALSSLSFTFSNGTVTPFDKVKMADYDKDTAKWTPATSAIEGTNAAGYVVTVEDARVDNKGNLNYYGVFDDDVYFGQKGHKIYWTLSIDTEKLSTAAAQNMVLTVLATDLAGNTTVLKTNASDTADTAVVLPVTAGGYLPGDEITESKYYRVTDGTTNKPTYQMDVVPYITGVETSISSFLSNDYTRSAAGDYPIKLTDSTGEVIKVSGFNLNPTNKALDTTTKKSDVRLSNNKTALDGTTKKGTGLKVEEGIGNDAGKWLVTMSASGNGYLTFFTNGIPSLNNVDSDAEYNKEDSLIHASLNNDRKFTLWNFTSLRSNASAPNANGATYPSMAMNGDTPQFAYVNNLKGYGIADFWDGSSEKEIYENWDLFTYTALALNSSGKRAALYDINVVQGGTGYQNDSGGILTNFFNDSTKVTYNSTDVFFQDNNVWLDGLYKKDVKAVLGRYEYPTIKLVGNDSISHVFYSVYDSLDDRIVFRYFTVGTGISSTDRHAINKDSTLYINKNQLDQVDASGNWPDYTSFNPNAWSNTNMRFYRTGTRTATSKNPQAFATGTTVGLYTATAGVPVNNSGTPVIVTTGNVTAARGVLVYYAGTNMYYTYATNNANTSWSTPVVLDSNCEASYISMVVDGANHVHIAYQNNIAGDVKYIYIPTYYDPATRKTVTVDSYLTVGDKLTLDVVGSTPYIGYKGLGNTAKVAWYVDNSGTPDVDTLTDGINSDEKFTGSWNVEIIPNRIVDSDTNRFNVGVGRNNKRPVIGYSNNQSGSKGLEYLTRTADLTE